MKRAIYTSIFTLGLVAIYAMDLDLLSLQELMAQPLPQGTQRLRKSTRTFQLKGKGRLSLRTIQGPIRIRTHKAKAGQKRIIVNMKTCYVGQQPLLPIDVTVNGDNISFSLRRQRTGWRQWTNSAGCGFYVSYDVIIPKGTELDLHSVNGSISVLHNEGRLNAQTVSGQITVQKSHETRLQTVSGEIKLRDQQGDLSVTTVSGDMNLQHTKGARVTLRAVSGQIKADKISVSGQLRSKNMSGSTRLIDLRPGTSNTLKSMSGELMVKLADKRGIRISTKTFSGSVQSNINQGQTHPKGYNGPSRRLRLKSFSGSITVQ